MDNDDLNSIPITQGYNTQTGFPRVQIKLRGDNFLGWEKTPVFFTTSGCDTWDAVKNQTISAMRLTRPDVVEIRMNVLGNPQGYYYDVNPEPVS